MLLSSGGGFDKGVYQEMLAALRPLTPSPPLNTALILPDGDVEIMRGMRPLMPTESAAPLCRITCFYCLSVNLVVCEKIS